MPIAPGIISALEAVSLGITTFEKAYNLIKRAAEQHRDLTPEELASIDLEVDESTDRFMRALERKRQREAGELPPLPDNNRPDTSPASIEEPEPTEPEPTEPEPTEPQANP